MGNRNGEILENLFTRYTTERKLSMGGVHTATNNVVESVIPTLSEEEASEQRVAIYKNFLRDAEVAWGEGVPASIDDVGAGTLVGMLAGAVGGAALAKNPVGLIVGGIVGGVLGAAGVMGVSDYENASPVMRTIRQYEKTLNSLDV